MGKSLVFNFYLAVVKTSGVRLEQEVWLLVCPTADLEGERSALRLISPGHLSLWKVCLFESVSSVHKPTYTTASRLWLIIGNGLMRIRHRCVPSAGVILQLREKSGLISLCLPGGRRRIWRLSLWFLCLIWQYLLLLLLIRLLHLETCAWTTLSLQISCLRRRF